MSLELETVHKVASLARLELRPEEADSLRAELAAILEHVVQLDDLSVQDVVPLAHAADLENAFRPDRVTESLDRSQTLANAPAHDGEFFLVPAVFRPTS